MLKQLVVGDSPWGNPIFGENAYAIAKEANPLSCRTTVGIGLHGNRRSGIEACQNAAKIKKHELESEVIF